MKVGIVGLGKMGLAIAHRLLKAGHQVVGYDINQDVKDILEQQGGTPVSELHDVVSDVDVVWLMIPAGNLVDEIIEKLKPFIKHQIIVDGGNSKYTDSQRRARELRNDNISFLDCGTSGGLHGIEHGFCLMVGGERSAYDKVISVFQAIAAPNGCAYVGPSGAGHYVKMVHNGIEYGLLQAYGEGFDLLKNGEYKDLNLPQIAHLWEHGSIIRSWILTLAAQVLAEDDEFLDISGKVAQSGMGKWTVEAADKEKVPVPVIKSALAARDESQKTGGNFGTKLVAMLRNAFGGHDVEEL